MDGESFLVRSIECSIHLDSVNRTWYIGFLRRSPAWQYWEYFGLEGKSLSYRVRDLVENGVPLKDLEVPSLRKLAMLDYQVIDDGTVYARYRDGSGDTCGRYYTDARECWMFIKERLQALELAVLQEFLTEDLSV